MNKGAVITGGIIIMGVAAGWFFAHKAKSVTPTTVNVPTEQQILSAKDFQTLNDYYTEIDGFLELNVISWDQYWKLYQDYVTRFYQLEKVAQS